MANEITALERDGSGNLSALFYYPIPAGIQVSGVIPTPSTSLPDFAPITQPEKDALDTGTAMFHIVKVGMPNGEDAAATLAKLRAKYAALQQRFRDEYTRRYQYAGQRFSKA